MEFKRIIETKYLNKTFGTGKESLVAVNDISFDLLEGEFLGIMGASGSGKTSLLNLISSNTRPTSGEIIFEGKDLTQFSRKEIEDYRGNLVTYIFQEYRLIANLTSYENILVPFALHNKEEDSKKIKNLAKELGVYESLDKYPGQLSGGQQQKVAAIRALAISPKLLLADEPTSALDYRSTEKIMEVFDKVNKEFNTSIIIASHDKYVASFCDRIILLKNGKIFNEISKNEIESRAEFEKRISLASKQLVR